MRILYIIIVFLGFTYFLFKKRYFDIFSLAFFSYFIYFLPALFGYINYPEGSQGELLDETYLVYIIVLTSVIIGATLFDIFNKISFKKIKININNIKNKKYYNCSMFVFIIFFLLFIYLNFNELISPGKPSFGRTHHMFTLTISISILITYLLNRKRTTIFLLVLLLIDVYGGNREAFATVFLSLFVIYNYKNYGKAKMGFNISNYILAMSSGVFLFSYKHIYQAVLRGDWDLVFNRITSFEFYINSITDSEPFITQMILNKTIEESFEIGIEYLFSFIVIIFPLSNYLFNIDIFTFSSEFTKTFYPDISFGLASNVFAEIIALNGFFSLFIFIIINLIIISIASYFLIYIDNVLIKSVSILMSSYWVFFLNRTGLLYQLTIQRRLIFWFMLILIISYFTNLIKFNFSLNN